MFSCNKGDEFIVDDADEDGVSIDLEYYQTFDNDELELVEPFNPKTAFLNELKDLMEKYQVSSIGDWEDEDATWEPKEIRFNDGSKIQFLSSCITPSNLFDYDK